MSSKQCFKCGKVKPLEGFYRHPHMADGRVGKCKECNKNDVRLHRLANLDRIREYDRERSKDPDRMRKTQEHIKQWRREDLRRQRAHAAVARALRLGRMASKACERCGSEKSMAHHESYDRPLDVIWLCQPCHKQRHKELVIAGIDP